MLVRASCSGTSGSQSCSSKYDAMAAGLTQLSAPGACGLAALANKLAHRERMSNQSIRKAGAGAR